VVFPEKSEIEQPSAKNILALTIFISLGIIEYLCQMPLYLKVVNVALLATVKFFYAPIYAFVLGLGFWGSLFGLLLGGLMSFLSFYFATDILLIYVKHLKPVIIKVTPDSTRLHYRKWKSRRTEKRQNRKRFTRRNRIFVRIRVKWGMWGIILGTPVALSIPFGAFLLRKYYGHIKIALPLALSAIIIEGFVLNTIYWFLMKDI